MCRSSRRNVLSALCTGTGVLVAGCTTVSSQEFPEETSSAACPPFDDATRVVCSEAVDPEAVPLALVPETQSIQPNEPTQFTLRNRSERVFETNFYHWELHKRVDGDWYYIAPRSWVTPMTPLEPSQDHAWTLTVETGRVSAGAPVEDVNAAESVTIAGLGEGHYAFGTDGWFADDSPEKRIGLASGFELTADPLQLTRTESIAETEWDGETLVARSTRGEPLGEDDPRDAYVLERTDSAGQAPTRLITEQVVRNSQLRDAIALHREFDADRVQLEEFTERIPPFGIRDARTYEYEGDQFRVTTIEGELS